VAYEQMKFQARLAGAEIKDSPKRSSTTDPYGEILERRKIMKEMHDEFASTIEQSLNKRL
jgi:hypothetical protein